MEQPRLRFKGFKDEWKNSNLGNEIEFIQGNNGVTDNIPILTISASQRWMKQSDRFSKVIAGKELKNYTLLKRGELSYNHGNSKLAKYGAVFELKEYKNALVPKVYHSFKVKSFMNPTFIDYLFSSKKTDRELRKLVSSGARMDGLLNINKKSFASIKINFPTLTEQTQIGHYFQLLDRMVELQHVKLKHLKRFKRGYLQKMFTDRDIPRLRFNGFNHVWKNNKLENIVNITMGQSPNSNNYTKNKNYDILVQGNADLYNGKIYPRIYTTQITKIAKKGNIIITVRAPVGDLAINQFSKVIIGRGVASLSGNRYIYYYLNNLKLNQYWNRISTGTTFEAINSNDLKSTNVVIPSLPEQTQIGHFFFLLDKQIELANQKLLSLQKTKKAYLQKMFI